MLFKTLVLLTALVSTSFAGGKGFEFEDAHLKFVKAPKPTAEALSGEWLLLGFTMRQEGILKQFSFYDSNGAVSHDGKKITMRFEVGPFGDVLVSFGPNVYPYLPSPTIVSKENTFVGHYPETYRLSSGSHVEVECRVIEEDKMLCREVLRMDREGYQKAYPAYRAFNHRVFGYNLLIKR